MSKKTSLLFVLMATLQLSSCGGGSSNCGPSTLAFGLITCNGGGSTKHDPAPITISGKVIDGYISGAKVCLDTNSDNVCDASEPFAITDSAGAYIFTYLGDTTGLHIVAEVPITATDSDSGKVRTAYTLMTPVSAPSAITALTTLVSNAMKANPSFTAFEAEASVIASNNVPSSSILSVDVTSNTALHQLSAAITQVIAQISSQLKSTASFSNAAGSKLNSLAVMHAIIAAQIKLIDMMQNPDGSVQSKYLTGSSVNTTTISALASNYVNSNIDSINAQVKAGPPQNSNARDTLNSGIYFLRKYPGGFYVDGNNTVTYSNFPHFMLSTYRSDSSISRVILDQQSVWRQFYSVIYELIASSWTLTAPRLLGLTFKGNCFSSLESVGGVTISACIQGHDISGQAISTFGFNCKDASGSIVTGCNTSSVFPSGSFGYDVVNIYDNDQYQAYISNLISFIPVNPDFPIDNLITYLSTSGSFAWTDECDISVSIASYNETLKTGVMNWFYNNACNNLSQGIISIPAQPSETSTFYTTSINSVPILVFRLTSTYKELHTPGTNFGTFSYVHANVNSNSAGMFSGNLYKKNKANYFYFGSGANLMNNTAWKFIQAQYGLPAY